MNLSEKAVLVKESSTLAITAKSKAMKAQGINVVSFGAGEPDFDTPDHIKEAAKEAISLNFTKYTPSSGTDALRKAIGRKLLNDNGLEYDYKQIIVSNGAKHSLSNIFYAILNPGDEVIIPAPFWLSYAEMIRMAGGATVLAYTDRANHYKANSALLKRYLSPKTKAILINSPNNPTGMVYSRRELEDIAEFANQNNLIVISDEIYEKLIYDDTTPHISIASLGQDIFNRTVVVNGLSKSYSMTGWRIGYTACCQELAEVIGNIQSHGASNPNSIAQQAAYAAITGDQSCVSQMRDEFHKRRDYIYQRISALPLLDVIRPEGAFYTFVGMQKLCGKEIKGNCIDNATDLAKVLLDQSNVAVVPCGDFGFDKHIRLSYAISHDEIKEGLDRIEGFIKGFYS